MCDEYDDEQMRQLWRRLAIQEASSDLDGQQDGLTEPLVKPADEPVLPTGRKARAVLH